MIFQEILQPIPKLFLFLRRQLPDVRFDLLKRLCHASTIVLSALFVKPKRTTNRQEQS